MKKLILFIAILCSVTNLTFAQYPTVTTRGDVVKTYTNGNNIIEIGNRRSSNARKAWFLARHSDVSNFGKFYSTLHLQPHVGDLSQYRGVGIGFPASSSLDIGTYLAVNGKVGIGTLKPSKKLFVKGGGSWQMGVSDNTGKKEMYMGYYNARNRMELQTITRTGINSGGYNWGNIPLQIMPKVVGFSGNVGIGVNNPGSYRLAVNGIVRAKEIVIETGWSDFVFEENYNLQTLEEVEQHIKEKGHLKDIPSAKEVEENGVALGEISSRLLQKIEELTLYTIEQQKEIKELKALIHSLKHSKSK